MDYEEFLIKEYKHWSVYLNKNQCYLGKVYIWANREDAMDFFDMTGEEKEEYFQIGNELKKAMGELFKPDLFNYATLANVAHHLHTHFIPRYKEERELFGVKFIDDRWGKNYAPYNRDFKLDKEILFKIRDLIKEKLI